ncbi:MAG: hypothetical protein JXO49_11980 [Deltaproteobacteria bacterium]|nr:hypothetical protein [Candidatus Anaeroferrophillus wilburensis]MBN2890052.1 hypothetical protein [Deltaproteobacteria bacterium]
MNKKSLLTIILLLLGLLILSAGCGQQSETFGQHSDRTATTVSIGELLTNPAGHQNQTVVIEGKILRECPTGCWFDLAEGNAVIYVDIEPSGLAIPQRIGKTAQVIGTVKSNGPQVSIIGKGVKIR